jgi:serine/threonine protein kinase/Tol biopolymer transport system component
MSPQQSIAHYKIVSKLGEGGMGAVYRATDTKLNRDVAIKVLPPAFADDAARLQRFEREAQVLASLNHPNIAAIYGIEQGAIVMELVEGQDLPSPVPLKTALEYALQIATGLEAAHEKGIVHRDLKPANIKVAAGGVVKLLDFGLAKAGDADPQGNNTQSPTLSLAMTQAGMIMGTASYMSPEQAAGKPVDRRSDIWSFGIVLWEMLSGKRLFEGETVSHTLADVLRADIDVGKLPAGTPAPIRDLVARCLDRDLKSRLRDIGEARIAIQRWLANPVTEPAVVTSDPPSRRPDAWMLGTVLFAAAAIALAVVHFRETPPDVVASRTSIPMPANAVTDSGRQGARFPAVSPDGRRFAIQVLQGTLTEIAIQSIDSNSVQVLAGTEGANGVFWSPDSQSIGFFINQKLKRIDLAGGPAITLADAIGTGHGAWGRDGTILYSQGSGPIFRIPASGGGQPAAVTAVPTAGGRHSTPWFLPDGRRFLYTECADRLSFIGDLYAGAVDGSPRSHAPILRQVGNVAYAQGYLLYGRDGSLMAQPFDAARASLTGPAVPLADQMGLLTGGLTGFSVSDNGLLVYQRGNRGALRSLGWVDRSGKVLETIGEPAAFGPFMLSPDGKQVAVSIRDTQDGGRDLWLIELARGVRTRFTFERANAFNPVWSPDGKFIVYQGDRGGHTHLFRKATDGSSAGDVVYADDNYKQPTQWTREGNFILFSSDAMAGADGRLWLISPTAGQKPTPLFEPSHGESQGQFSPDGKWIAYRSTESGNPEIYVSAFPGPGAKHRVSTSPVGGIPGWKPDGTELYYIARNRDLMAVSVKSKGGKLELSAPVKLFGGIPVVAGRNYDVSADGKRFLTFVKTDQATEEPLTLLQNWTAVLKK